MMNEDQIRETLQSLRDDPVPADSLVRVRARIEERTAEGKSARRWWWLAAAGGAVCTAAALFVLTAVRPPIHAPNPVNRVAARQAEPNPVQPAVAVLKKSLPATAQRAERAQVRKRVAASKRQSETGGILIRIETPDPDVVLYFVGDGAGE